MSRNRIKAQGIQIEYGNEVTCGWSSKQARVHVCTEMDFALRVELLHANFRLLPPLLNGAATGAAEELSK